MDITLQDYQKKITLKPSHIVKITKKILAFERINSATLSIVFVSRQRMRALNKKYLRRDHETDVLAFDTTKKRSISRGSRSIAGDIIISTDAALNNSKEFNTTKAEELSLYLIHGILHLLGYEDHKASDIRKIRKREQDILDYLGSSIKKCIH